MNERFTAIVSEHFSAAHFIPSYKGNCCNLHGHNWEVVAAISSDRLDNLGLSVDLRTVKKKLREILQKFDHTNLNENANLNNLPPTAENIAVVIYNELAEHFADASVLYVEVFEGPNAAVRYERLD